ncbi:hypothetical protein E4U57_006176 [Claviceps arundinis]|uniref:Uncharacterized protein n=1 Tax=Claviceps arundinis TaxID=1623583 RepID=A0A9P7MLK4_9HYPO|nr:hypothetical protein E4U57_006176 [Claviceps arundinis]KAG5958375.1 hypothetical protein E4U56_005628 [Claviceps arundinis]
MPVSAHRPLDSIILQHGISIIAPSRFSRRSTSKWGKLSSPVHVSLIDAKNKVPEQQRYYQQAYKAHTRIWMIGSRSRWYMTPYLVMLWGGFGAALYAAGRKVTGHNTWFGKN